VILFDVLCMHIDACINRPRYMFVFGCKLMRVLSVVCVGHVCCVFIRL